MKVEEHILNVAESLFNSRGYTAVGINLIRDKAKASKTTIYRHFGDKNGLIIAVLMRRHLRFLSSLSNSLVNASNCADKVTAILDWHFEWFQSETFSGCMFMHAFAEFHGDNEKIAAIAIEHKKSIFELLLNTMSVIIPNREEKAGLLMTIVEGMIVRAEFSLLAHEKPLYKDLMLRVVDAIDN